MGGLVDKINYIYNNSDLFIITVIIPSGSIYENYGNNKKKNISGVSHFLEHVLFKHTENYTGNELLKEFTRIGGYYNASTDKDETMFYVKTLSENHQTAVDLLYDIVVKPVFRIEDIRSEKKVVLEELAQTRDDFYNGVYDDSTATLLAPNNIYLPTVIGRKTHLQTSKINDIVKYYKQRYGNFMVVINCDVSHKDNIHKYVTSKFGKNEKLTFDEPGLLALSNVFQDTPKVRIVVNNTFQFNTTILFPSYKYCDVKQNVLLNFVTFCLTDAGLYSILSYEIREKRGLVYSIKMNNERMRYLGMLRITFGTSNKDIVNILTVIMTILNDMKSNGLSRKNLQYFKDSYKSRIMYKFTNEEYRASWYGDNFFYGSKQTEGELLKSINKITNNDVKNLCKDVFDFNKMGFYSNGNYDEERNVGNEIKNVIAQNSKASLKTQSQGFSSYL